MKRIMDIAVSLALLTVFSPIMLATAAVVRIKMGSPILFTQQRPGLHGQPFYVYKFRTMSRLTDGQGKLQSDQMRLTETGKILRKLSLDELPQFINVLKGDMSLVGPRPLLMEYLPLYTKEQSMRHNVRPGITGWAQVNGRNNITWSEKFSLDVWYVKNHSFMLDLKILWMTVKKVLKTEGITMNGQATTRNFDGNN